MRKFVFMLILMCAASVAFAGGAKDGGDVAHLEDSGEFQKPGYGEGGGSGAAGLPSGAEPVPADVLAGTAEPIPSDTEELSVLSGKVKVRTSGGRTSVSVSTGLFKEVALSFPKPASPEVGVTVGDVAALKGKRITARGLWSPDGKAFTVLSLEEG